MKITAGIATALLVAGCSSSSAIDFASDPEPSTHQIIYDLAGTAESADLTMQVDGSGASQQQDIPLPITNKAGSHGLRFEAVDGQFLYLSAQNDGSGTMTCKITEDGVVISTNTSSGEYAIVTCSGTA